MLRRTPLVMASTRTNFISPPVLIPDEYHQRFAMKDWYVETDKRDPKNKWGLHNHERLSHHPSLAGFGRHNFGFYETRGGLVMEIPPVPVYRSHIWCQGHILQRTLHPKIFLKVPRGQGAVCKWCRLSFINMSTDTDTDEDWEEVCWQIATKPEDMEDVKRVFRRIDGSMGLSNFTDGREPDPYVFRTAYNPELAPKMNKETMSFKGMYPDGEMFEGGDDPKKREALEQGEAK